MAPPIVAMPAMGARAQNSAAIRRVVPAIPLHYLKQKPKAPAVTIATAQEITSPEVSAKKASESTAFTPTRSPPLSTGDNTATPDDIFSEDSENKGVTASLVRENDTATSHVRESDGSGDTLVGVDETGEFGQGHINLVVESDKSSTLANETRPPTTEPRPSSLTVSPPPSFFPAMQENLQQRDDASSFSGSEVPRQSIMHHGHPDLNLGSLTIATSGYAESRGSSPLHAGLGIQHSPADPMFNANTNGHMQHYPNGFPMNPRPPPGFFRPQESHIAHPQMAAFTSPDAYSPSIHPGKSEQQFPSYPSSVQNEFEGNGLPFHGRFTAPIAPNGVNGHAEDMHGIQQPRPRVNGAQNGSQTPINGNLVPHRPMPPQFPMRDHLDGLLEYLSDQFDNAAYADYLLELHYSDCRAHPIRIAGHNLLFARSPALNNLMATTTGQLTVDGSKRLLRLETDDRFVTSEGFYKAMSRLYGLPLLDEGGPSMARSPESPVERFNLALGYAAAGHILHISPVVDRGIMVACRLITWNTLEKALDFAIDGGLDSHWTFDPNHRGYSRSTYGRMANHLIQSALDFTLSSVPANFDLDTSVPDFSHNSRLPVINVPDVQPIRPSKHQLKGNPRLSAIKFGDVTFSSEDTPEATAAFVFSKLLISLPFHLLKYVLEHPRLGNVAEGWTSTKLRQKLILTAVEERESRRLKVFNAPIPNSRRMDNQTQWEAVGWKESVIISSTPSSPDLPTLTRTWVGFTLPEK